MGKVIHFVKMKIYLILLILFCIASKGLCLKCYEWSDKTQLGETVECPPEANACLKAEAEVYKTKGYARSCGMLEGDAQDGDCIGPTRMILEKHKYVFVLVTCATKL